MEIEVRANTARSSGRNIQHLTNGGISVPPFTMKTEGIVLVALGKRGYFFAAYNLAVSIKFFNKDIKIHLIHDGANIHQLGNTDCFDSQTLLGHDDCHNKLARLDPGKVKVNLYKWLPYYHNLYLDVDAICLKNLQPFIDKLKDETGAYFTDVRGIGGIDDVISYGIWAPNAKVWDFFDLKEDARFPAIQSSFAFIKKQKKAEMLFKRASKFYDMDFPLTDLSMQWGGTMPDELIFSAALAKENIQPKEGLRPIFFGKDVHPGGYSAIVSSYFLSSIYGNGKGKTLTKRMYIKWYDALMRKYTNGNHIYKAMYIMPDKHVNSMK